MGGTLRAAARAVERRVRQHYERYVFRTTHWAPNAPDKLVPNDSRLSLRARRTASTRRGAPSSSSSVGMLRIVQGRVSLSESVSGPITLYDVGGRAGREGHRRTSCAAMALVSINLGLINLLAHPGARRRAPRVLPRRGRSPQAARPAHARDREPHRRERCSSCSWLVAFKNDVSAPLGRHRGLRCTTCSRGGTRERRRSRRARHRRPRARPRRARRALRRGGARRRGLSARAQLSPRDRALRDRARLRHAARPSVASRASIDAHAKKPTERWILGGARRRCARRLPALLHARARVRRRRRRGRGAASRAGDARRGLRATRSSAGWRAEAQERPPVLRDAIVASAAPWLRDGARARARQGRGRSRFLARPRRRRSGLRVPRADDARGRRWNASRRRVPTPTSPRAASRRWPSSRAARASRRRSPATPRASSPCRRRARRSSRWRSGRSRASACSTRARVAATRPASSPSRGPTVDACDACDPAQARAVSRTSSRGYASRRATRFAVDWTVGSGDVHGRRTIAVLVDAPCSGIGTLRRRPELAPAPTRGVPRRAHRGRSARSLSPRPRTSRPAVASSTRCAASSAKRPRTSSRLLGEAESRARTLRCRSAARGRERRFNAAPLALHPRDRRVLPRELSQAG